MTFYTNLKTIELLMLLEIQKSQHTDCQTQTILLDILNLSVA